MEAILCSGKYIKAHWSQIPITFFPINLYWKHVPAVSALGNYFCHHCLLFLYFCPQKAFEIGLCIFFTLILRFYEVFVFVSFSIHYFMEATFLVPWKKNNSETNLILILMSCKNFRFAVSLEAALPFCMLVYQLIIFI